MNITLAFFNVNYTPIIWLAVGCAVALVLAVASIYIYPLSKIMATAVGIAWIVVFALIASGKGAVYEFALSLIPKDLIEESADVVAEVTKFSSLVVCCVCMLLGLYFSLVAGAMMEDDAHVPTLLEILGLVETPSKCAIVIAACIVLGPALGLAIWGMSFMSAIVIYVFAGIVAGVNFILFIIYVIRKIIG